MLAVALFIIVLVSALIDNERLTRLTWLSFSAFPLLGVVVISWLARVQKQFYLRGSGQREHS